MTKQEKEKLDAACKELFKSVSDITGNSAPSAQTMKQLTLAANLLRQLQRETKIQEEKAESPAFSKTLQETIEQIAQQYPPFNPYPYSPNPWDQYPWGLSGTPTITSIPTNTIIWTTNTSTYKK